MIARVWRGWTRWEDVTGYLDYLRRTGLAEYGSTEGNRGYEVLCRRDGDRAEFVLVSFWDSMDAVERFADPIGDAVFYPEDDRYLVDRELTVSHFQVLEHTRPSQHV